MYKNILKILLTSIIFCVILGSYGWCNPLTDNQDKAAHAVTSFTISTVTYVLCRNHAKELDKNECLGTALLVSFTVGMIKESIIDSKPSLGDNVSNFVVIGLSIPFLVYEF